ncbi:MAG: four helix bundle protein [Alphaproteobacteria bacterium]|uniref:four helix bundle protein n=1 Tax=Brevundimonas sp. TaxID=1871086 RepID=UPI000DB3A039|nr:four helix bundle protein [Brevundimonas sp.]MBU1271608.1 four helix bundle protein [Alphaproteobacteria bacterium]MBJ7320460.1 four helix bundle protein [Brevundimonas sp.]MBU1522440.1 four helix bundle protein [Alphaproteobacteria bacterium]MBU2030959.1 four helix bundle protein [Alphaproteobacteria bacterium]MBU2163602.1 four helix bundle protein [Alphaproteobacteria bacterium]
MSGEWRVVSGEVRHYRDLLVWQKALTWVELVYAATREWPSDERFGLISQVRRACVSVPSNIAEGCARRSTPEFLRFLSIARGSLAEVETQLIIAQRLTYLEDAALTRLLDSADEISRMLSGLISKLEERTK